MKLFLYRVDYWSRARISASCFNVKLNFFKQVNDNCKMGIAELFFVFIVFAVYVTRRLLFIYCFLFEY